MNNEPNARILYAGEDIAENENYLCPYTLKIVPGQQVAEMMNLEHVFPRALGGPADYGFYCLKGINSAFGEGIDAALSSAPQMSSLRTEFSITGYNNPPTHTIVLHPEDGSPDVSVTYDHSGNYTTYVNKPVVADATPVHGPEVPPETTVTSSGSLYEGTNPKQRGKIIQPFITNNERKAEVITSEETSTTHLYKIAEEFDELRIRQGMLKIVYAALVHEYPEYINDPLATNWRHYLFAENIEDAMTLDVEAPAGDLATLLSIMAPLVHEDQHVVFWIGLTGDKLMAGVRFFGDRGLSFLAIASETSAYGIEPGSRHSIICNTRERHVAQIDDQIDITAYNAFMKGLSE